MKLCRKIGNIIFALLKGAGITGVVVIFILPYLWLIGSAFKSREELFRFIFPFSWKTLIPVEPTLENIKSLFVEGNFGNSMLLSFIIAVITVVMTVTICSMMAFVLARLEFPGRKLVFALILATMLVPFEARLVPLFFVIQDLHLDNTVPALILPWVSNAFIIFLLRQHFLDLPGELYDSALVDGCSHIRVYWNIYLPNIKPALISAGLIEFIWSWSSYIWPNIVLRDPDLRVVPVAIAFFFNDEHILWEQVFAGAFVATLPTIILFLLMQRYYISGMVTSGLKG